MTSDCVEKGVEKMEDAREIIIQAKNVGVTYNNKMNKDDYKSKTIDLLKRRKKNTSLDNNDDIIWPLRNIDFTAYKGEILGIVGSNGSGKTTLCKVLTGILRPDEGEIEIDGKVSALFSLGMGFNRKLTGRENVFLNGMMMGLEKAKVAKLIDEIHEFSGLGDFFERPMKKYSSGMRARLGFSVAAHLEPEILILDEALNTGDRAFANKATVKIKELVGRAKMVIVVTHSHRYAKKTCDRLIWLEKGEIKQIGDPKTVLESYEATVPKIKRRPKKKLELKTTNIQLSDATVIKAENIGIKYKMKKQEHWALKDISFKIKEGEVIGIIGRNGAGKSTLCKVITKILTPDSGKITVNGETTALLSYGLGFNMRLSGKDNVFLNGMLLGIPMAVVHANYQNIVDFSGLNKVMDESIKRYSSGMRARLGFSIAAALQPDIFIIDEALSTGDMAFKQKASEKIQDMMEQAKAVIIVSHSMSFVETVCTRAIWIEQGEVMGDGIAEEVVEAYRNYTNVKPSNKAGQ